MFRQISVHPDDQDLQRIVWRESGETGIQDFRLATLTYGTACAPFLALRTLIQLAHDEGESFPLGAHSILYKTFVDDVLPGANDVSAALQIREQLLGIMNSAGFPLDKWSANHPALSSDLDRTSVGQNSHSFNPHEPLRMLGIIWIPTEDALSSAIPTPVNTPSDIPSKSPTKRSILSSISRVFDPSGWISPITVVAKILIQDLWLLKVDWDAAVPLHVEEKWEEYSTTLTELTTLRIPRWIGYAPGTADLQLHGFADTSTRAYSAVVYLRLPSTQGGYTVPILTSKTKGAPLKTLSVPELELCSAALLVKLLLQIRRSQTFANIPISAWLDRRVALAWINKHPRTWATIVANRVSFIQTSLPEVQWNYVPTKENPADLATRGTFPSGLQSSSLWWQGPRWLTLKEEFWPRRPTVEGVVPGETRSESVLVAHAKEQVNVILELITNS